MIGIPFADNDCGPAWCCRLVKGQLIPAITPHHLCADGNLKSPASQGGDEVATGRVIRVEFGKDRADLVKPDQP